MLETMKGLGKDLSFPPLEGEEIQAFNPPWHSETALPQGPTDDTILHIAFLMEKKSVIQQHLCIFLLQLWIDAQHYMLGYNTHTTHRSPVVPHNHQP